MRSLALVTIFLVASAIPSATPSAAAACGAAGAPTTTVYLPNVTKTLGGPDGWVTPFIVQNVGSAATTLEVSFYRFSDGGLVACRGIPGLLPGTSFADVPNNDADLPDNTQFSVVVRSLGSPVVAVVNEQQGAGDRAEAASYVGLSSGATSVFLPYIAKAAGGWRTTFIIQNLAAATASVTVSLTTNSGGGGPVLTRTVAPGRSQAVDPLAEPSIAAGEYSATVTSDQRVAVVVNGHNDGADVAAPRAFSYNGLASPAAQMLLPYVARNTDGIGRQTRVVMQNAGTSPATPTLTFQRLGGGPAVTVVAPGPVAPGAPWSFDPRYLADGVTPCPAAGASTCLAEGEHSVVIGGGSFVAIAVVTSPATALGYTATSAAPSRVYLPNITRTLGGALGWTTPILIQSAGATSATLRWYRFADGSLALTQPLAGLSTGAAVRVDPRQLSGLSDDTQYAVVLDGNGPITAIVTELNFSGGDGAMAYEGFPATTPATTRNTLGVNVDLVADWITQLPFVDVVKESRPWTSQAPGMAWGMGGPLALDERGWIRSLRPDQYAEIVMLTGGHYPVGDYALLYNGHGTLELVGSQVTVVSRDTGRWIVHLDAGSGSVYLRETATDPSDPIRDLRFIMPGFEATYASQPFNPAFVDRLRPFNVIRFLDWMSTGAGTQQGQGSMPAWAMRTKPDYAFQSVPSGVAPEYMLRLANLLHAEPWLTLPHDLDDDGVRQLAAMVRDQLDPSLRAWVEYSNETWNSSFPQSRYVQDRGIALGLSADRLEAGERYTGLRSSQIFSIWRTVVPGDRSVRVISSQFTTPTWTALPLIAGNGPGAADALAVGAYFDCMPELLDTPAGAAQVKAMTDDAVLDRCERDILGTTRDLIQQNLDIARRSGLRLVAYEAGQGLVGVGPVIDDQAVTDKLTRVNRLPRMYDLYLRFFSEWRDMVGDQINHLSFCDLFSRYGSWGAMEWLDQDLATAPKYRALLDLRPTMNPDRAR